MSLHRCIVSVTFRLEKYFNISKHGKLRRRGKRGCEELLCSVVIDEHLTTKKLGGGLLFVDRVHQVHVYRYIVGYVFHSVAKFQSILLRVILYRERVVHFIYFPGVLGRIYCECDEIIFCVEQDQLATSQHFLVVQHESNITLQDTLAQLFDTIHHTLMNVIFCSGDILYSVSLKYFQNSSLAGI